MNSDSGARTSGLVFLALGLLLLAISFGILAYGTWFRVRAEQVTGTVTEVELRHYADGNTYCPVIRYATASGQTFTHYSNVCSMPADYEPRQQVRLYVDRNDPNRLQLDNWFSKWFAVGLLGLMGTIFSAVGTPLIWPGFWTRLLGRV